MDFSIIISAVSVAIAGTALGWNIYRDIVSKPRLRAHIGVYDLLNADGKNIGNRIFLEGTNHGPGDVVIRSVVAKRNHIRRHHKYFVALPENLTVLSDSLPCKKGVGDSVRVAFPHVKDSFLGQRFIKIGFLDSFGKYHWATRKSLIQARVQFKKDFPEFLKG